MVPKKRQPAHPGRILLEQFLQPMELTQADFVRHLGGTWTNTKLNELIHGRRGITVDIALAFSQALNTSPQFWLNLQMTYDLFKGMQNMEEIPPIQEAR